MSKITISAYEFLKKFPDERTARLYIEDRRWQGRPVCPHCGEVQRVQVRKVDGYFRCLACKTDFTVRTGTIFERSHVPLDKWLYVIYLLVTSRKGVSSLQLSKEIEVTQKTAWLMLQRLRKACNGTDGGLLSGVFEADETCIGGKEMNKHESKRLKAGRGTTGKTGVVGLRERDGHVKATVIADTAAVKTIQAEVRDVVALGARSVSTSTLAYRGMSEYHHLAVNTAPNNSSMAWRTPIASRAFGRCSNAGSVACITISAKSPATLRR